MTSRAPGRPSDERPAPGGQPGSPRDRGPDDRPPGLGDPPLDVPGDPGDPRPGAPPPRRRDAPVGRAWIDDPDASRGWIRAGRRDRLDRRSIDDRDAPG